MTDALRDINRMRQQLKVLFVEDDEEMRMLLRSLVLQIGFRQVIGFPRLNEALDRLEYDEFGLAIIDLNLGDQDGATLISAVRANPRACIASMPVLVASTAATGDRIQSALLAGADGFLCKPFSISSLERQIHFASASARARGPISRAVQTGPPAAPPTRNIMKIE